MDLPPARLGLLCCECGCHWLESHISHCLLIISSQMDHCPLRGGLSKARLSLAERKLELGRSVFEFRLPLLTDKLCYLGKVVLPF